jgi:hypothetical protein
LALPIKCCLPILDKYVLEEVAVRVSFLTKSLLSPPNDHKHRLEVVSDKLLHCGIELEQRLHRVAVTLMLRCT